MPTSSLAGSGTAHLIFGETITGRMLALVLGDNAGEALTDGSLGTGSPERAADFASEIVSLLVDPHLVRRGEEAGRRDDRGSQGTTNLRVLVVDDDEGVRATLRHMLSQEGCQVGEASNGQEVLPLVGEPWDMAILDLVLPDEDGLSILGRMRQRWPDLEGVVLTGHSSFESSIDALRQGAADYLTKPFTRPEVTRLVKHVREKKRLLHEREALMERLQRTVFELELLQSVTRVTSSTLDPRDLVATFAEALPQVLAPDLVRCWARGPDGVASWEVGRTASGGKLVAWARRWETQVLAALAPRAGGQRPDQAGGRKPARRLAPERDPDLSWIVVPLFDGQELGGLMTLASARPQAFPLEDACLLYRVAAVVSLTVERSRELVANEKRRMESVVERMGEGVVVTDARGAPLVINPAARLLLSLPLEGEPDRVGGLTEGGRALLSHLQGVLRRREVTSIREFLLEGTPPRRLSVQSGLVSGRSGEIRGTVALLEDVTGRREADLLQSEFVSAVSHELRTPLSCVKNYVDMVLDRRAGDLSPTQERFLATARRNIDRLTHFIDNLLSFSRREGLRGDLSPEVVDLAALTQVVLEGLRAEGDERGVEFVSTFPEEGLEVRGDKDRLYQAFHLLLRQATKVSLRGSRLQLTGRAASREEIRPPADGQPPPASDRRWAQMRIQMEHAEAMSTADVKNLFLRFRPSGQGSARPLAASGLNLALARSVFEDHEGMLWAEALPAGGLCFELLLPMDGPSLRQSDLLERIRGLLERSRREGLAMSLVFLRLNSLGADEVPGTGAGEAGNEGTTALRAVAGAVRCCLRHEDQLFPDPAQGELAVILEGTDAGGAAVVGKRLVERVRALGESAPGPLAGHVLEIGWSTFPQEGVTAQEIVALARRRCVPVTAPPAAGQ